VAIRNWSDGVFVACTAAQRQHHRGQVCVCEIGGDEQEIVDSKTQVTKVQLAHHKTQTTNRKPQTTNHKPQTTNTKPQTYCPRQPTHDPLAALMDFSTAFHLMVCDV